MLELGNYCRVEGCQRTTHAGSLCSAHFQREKRTGSVMASKPVLEKQRGCNLNPDGTRKQCSLTDCYRPASSRGFCGMHWKRVKRNDGTPYQSVPAGELTTHKAERRAEQRMRKGA